MERLQTLVVSLDDSSVLEQSSMPLRTSLQRLDLRCHEYDLTAISWSPVTFYSTLDGFYPRLQAVG